MKNKASLSIIFLTVFIDLMGFGILIPLLPTFASKALNVSDFGIGIIIAIYSLVQFLTSPLLGRVSDRIGRRPIILVTLLLTAVSYVIFSFANTFLILLLSRMLAGLGGSNIGVAQAYIADITTKHDRSKGMGIIGAAFGLGFVFGPFIGGLLSGYGYAVAGFASAGFSLLAFLFAFFFLPESLREKRREKKFNFKLFEFKFVKEVIAYPNLGMLVLLFFVIVFSIANIYGTFALLGFKEYGFTDKQNGYLFGIIGLVGAIVQGGLIRYLAKYISDKMLVIAGLFLMSIGLGMLPYGGNFLGLALVATVLAFGTGILQPTILSLVSKYAPDENQGAVLGLNQSLASLARVLGPLWGGFAFDFLGYQFPFLTGAAFTFVALIFIIYNLKIKQLKEASN